MPPAIKLCLWVLTFGLVGCDTHSLPPDGIIYCLEGKPETLNPQHATSGTTLDATANHIFDTLLSFDEQGELLPKLASSWHSNADKSEWTFTLRPDVPFHRTERFQPSRALNSEDVKFSFERIINDAHPYHNIGQGDFAFFNSIDFKNKLDGIETPSADIVVFKFNQPSAHIVQLFATQFAIIQSAEYAEQLRVTNQREHFDRYPIGTGPFILSEYQVNRYLRFERHPTYWQDSNGEGNLIISIVADASKRFGRLISGDCHATAYPKANEIKSLKSQTRFNLSQSNGLNLSYWAFNTLRPPMDNLLFRQGLQLAVDRKAIIEDVYQQLGIEANSLLPPSSWAYKAPSARLQYQPERARKLIELSGVDLSKLDLSIFVSNTARVYNPNPVKTAELIQQNLADIGVKSHIEMVDWSIMSLKLAKKQYHSVLLGWSADTPDPDNFFTPLISCSAIESNLNRSNWCHKKVDKLLAEAHQTSDRAARIALYQQIQQQIDRYSPILYLAHGNRLILSDKKLQGLDFNTISGVSFLHTRLEKQP